MYGYPTIRNVSIAPQENYLCVSHRAEKRWVQPLRLLAGFVGAPAVMAASYEVKCPYRSKVVFTTGLGLGIWSLAVYYYAHKEMRKANV